MAYFRNMQSAGLPALVGFPVTQVTRGGVPRELTENRCLSISLIYGYSIFNRISF